MLAASFITGLFFLGYKNRLVCILGGLTYEIQCPTDLFTILETRDQEIGEFYAVQERDTTDFEAPKL